MADAATDLARSLVESLTPGGSPIMQSLGGLLEMLKGKPPPTNQRLPRIVPDDKGNLIDLNTGGVVGRVSNNNPPPNTNIAQMMRDALAQRTLQQQGSVMARSEKPQWRKESPLIDAVLSNLDKLVALGPSVGDALTGPAANIAGLASLLLGGERKGGQEESGVYRDLGLLRQGGALNPQQFAAKLMEQPNFARFKQLIEGVVRNKLGPEFTGFRGHGLNDPMAGVAVGKGLPPATSITTKSPIAEGFAREAATAGVPSVMTRMDLTPESVLALLPKRGSAYRGEAEMLVDPRWAENLKTLWKMNPVEPGASVIPTLISQPHSVLDTAMEEALQKLRPARPLPGSGAHLASESADENLQMGIVQTLKNALQQAAQPPEMENLY